MSETKSIRVTAKIQHIIDHNDAFGWHVIYGDTNHGFYMMPAKDIIEIAKWRGWKLASVTGNGLAFTK